MSNKTVIYTISEKVKDYVMKEGRSPNLLLISSEDLAILFDSNVCFLRECPNQREENPILILSGMKVIESKVDEPIVARTPELSKFLKDPVEAIKGCSRKVAL